MDPQLCAKGCGFYGSAANKNLCSKCYNNYIKENMIKSQDEGLNSENKNTKDEVLAPESSTSHIKPWVFKSFITDIGASIDDHAPNTIIESKKNVRKKCKSCDRKVGLTGFHCRCGDVFCGRHRYPEEHACEVNYKDIGRQILSKENPICISDKLGDRI